MTHLSLLQQSIADAKNGIPDARWHYALEYCGYSVPMYIVRFCDEMIGCARDETKAQHIIDVHYAEHQQKLDISNV